MRSNLLTTLGVILILVCVVLLGGWKIAIGLFGVVLLAAGYTSWRADAAIVAAERAKADRPAAGVKK